MIDINELRQSLGAVQPEEVAELLDRLEAAEKERDALRAELLDAKETVRELFHGAGVANMTITTLRAKVEAMEKQEPVAQVAVHKTGGNAGIAWKAAKRHEAQGQPASSVPECPYPCGWRSLLKLAIEDGAYLARSINEDEPVTENARAVTMRMVLRLRDVLMALNNAAPESKP